MKNILYFTALLLISSCGMKIPYTEEIKNRYDLDEVGLKKVQFYTSSTIIMVRSNKQEKQGLTDGKLVTNETVLKIELLFHQIRNVFLKVLILKVKFF